MKIKIIKILAIILLVFGVPRFFLNLFLGEISLNTLHHLFFNLLWIVAAIGLFKIKNWGRLLTLSVSAYYAILFCVLLIMTLLDSKTSDITFYRAQGFLLSIVYIIVLNIRTIKEAFHK